DLTGSGFSGTVTNANLRLNVRSQPGSTRTHNATRVTSAWLDTMLWAGQPTLAASFTGQATVTASSNGTDIYWTVTSDVNGFVNSSLTNYGWRISDANEAVTNATTGYNTTDNLTTDKTIW